MCASAQAVPTGEPREGVRKGKESGRTADRERNPPFVPKAPKNPGITEFLCSETVRFHPPSMTTLGPFPEHRLSPGHRPRPARFEAKPHGYDVDLKFDEPHAVRGSSRTRRLGGRAWKAPALKGWFPAPAPVTRSSPRNHAAWSAATAAAGTCRSTTPYPKRG